MTSPDLSLDALGDELYTALRQCQVLEPLTRRHPALTIEQAYRIQQRLRTASASSVRRSASPPRR